MELDDIKNMHRGAKIGILGSGPSLTSFKDQIRSLCDIVIACNGSLLALNSERHSIDYFLYGDQLSPQCSWFRESEKFRTKTGSKVVRILPSSLLPYDDIVLKSQKKRLDIGKELSRFEENSEDSKAYRSFMPEEAIILNNGVNFSYVGDKVKNIDTEISGSGTITGIGAQLAYLMGANRINLFGCGFNNSTNGKTYAYDSKDETGETSKKHIDHMNNILNQIKNRDCEVISYGPTNLSVQSIDNSLNFSSFSTPQIYTEQRSQVQ